MGSTERPARIKNQRNMCLRALLLSVESTTADHVLIEENVMLCFLRARFAKREGWDLHVVLAPGRVCCEEMTLLGSGVEL